MPRLYLVDSGDTLGEISAEQLQFLIDQLEEEDDTDQDYFINRETLELLREAGCDPDLAALLEKALTKGDEDGVDIAWE
jgi:hypothetical protein